MTYYSDLILYAIKGLRRQALRSWLTILGIVIGVAAIVVLVSLGEGVSSIIKKEMEQFGPQNIIIMPGNVFASFMVGPSGPPTQGKLYKSDIERLSGIDGIRIISPFLYGAFSVSYRGEVGTFTVTGIEPENYADAFPSLKIAEGRMLKDGDRYVLVIGDKIAHGLFKEDLRVNSVLRISGKNFQVVGILERTGGTFDDTDTSVIAPFKDIEELLSKNIQDNEISGILVVMKDNWNMKEAEEEIKKTLREAHRVREGEEDFTVLSAETVSSQVKNISDILSVFLGAISAISLMVGGITIANTMFMSVLERRQEIGILRAMGATKKWIRFVFLVESAIIGIIGGSIGIIVGLLIISIFWLIGIPATPTLSLILFCGIFSLLIGIISGIIPASRSAEMDAVEALRYE
ncbi:MAG: ABC transporter permease [Candidatus Anstonellales archaeon]